MGMDIFYFLHSYIPSRIAFMIGDWPIYWYGVLMAVGIIAALFVALKLAPRYNIKTQDVWDLSGWLIICGVIGARLYDICLELTYYWSNPLAALKIWNGGLAIHGALLGGLIAVIIFIKKRHLSFWNMAAVLLPAVALGQAIGRWGNWFNQELFGRPSNWPWSIPIEVINRPTDFAIFSYFQPTFLYESLGLLVLFILLFNLARKQKNSRLIAAAYLIGYGTIRFLLEFIKIDATPMVINLRWPQIFSLIMIVAAVIILKTKKGEVT